MQKSLVTLNLNRYHNALKGCQRCLGLAGKSAVRRRLCWVLVDSEGKYPLGGRSVEIIAYAVGCCLCEAVLEGGVS